MADRRPPARIVEGRSRAATPLWPWALALVTLGAGNALAFEPWGWWWLQPLSFAVLMVAVLRSPPARAFGLTWLFALSWFGSSWWWLHISLHRYGGLPSGLAAAAVLALAAAMALYLALAMAAAARWRSGRPLPDALLLAGACLLADLARGHFFTGFPWSAPGYAHTHGPLAVLAPWVGVYGIGAVSAFFSACAAVAWTRAAGVARASRPPLRSLAGLGVAGVAGIALVAAAALGPREFTQYAGALRATLLQPAIAQDLKFDPDRMQADLQRLIGRMHAANGPLVVAPESVVPLPLAALDAGTWQALSAPFRAGERAVLFGIFLGDSQQGYVNSVVGLSAAAALQPPGFYAYGKRHLLPFGEFTPPGFGWFVDLLELPLGDQTHGSSFAPFHAQGQRLRPLICYEDLFAEELVDSVLAADAATVFVNVSNLAWFGHFMVLDQHLQFSQMRALEFQRPFIRSTNTGATAAIDHRGQVLDRLPAGQAGELDVVVEGRIGVTPYARWLGPLGVWPLWVLGALCVWVGRSAARRVAASPLQRAQAG